MEDVRFKLHDFGSRRPAAKVPPPRFGQPDCMDLHLEDLVREEESHTDDVGSCYMEGEEWSGAFLLKSNEIDHEVDDNYYGP